MWLSLVSISLGASLGAILRWALSLRFNPLVPAMPIGTLAANLLGAYLIGIAIGVFAQLPQLDPHWRLFVITGFLGALTTFSSFSAEMFTLLQEGRLTWALAGVAAHVIGSITMTFFGATTLLVVAPWFR